jgi:hypothetical protein
MTTASFPIRIEELSRELLSETFGSEVVDFESIRIGADRGMLGMIYRLDLTFVEPTSAPTTVVAKFASQRPESLASAKRGGTHRREMNCYAKVLPETPVTSPAVHAVHFDPDTCQYMLIQEYVAADTSIDQIEGLDVERARMVLKQLARLHSYWWNSPRLAEFDWLPPIDSPDRRTNLRHIAKNGWEQLITTGVDSLTPSERQFGQQLPDRIDLALQNLATHTPTLLHGDLRTDNLLYDLARPRVVLVDWQGVGSGPPSFDLAYFLTQSMSTESRRRHQEQLIQTYVEEMSRLGCPATRTELLAGYRDALHYGLVIACAVALVGDSGESRRELLARTCGRRALDALIDEGVF